MNPPAHYKECTKHEMAELESVLAAAIGLCDYQMSFTLLMAVRVQRNFCPGWVLIMARADACAVLRKDILDCPAPVAAEILNSGLFLPHPSTVSVLPGFSMTHTSPFPEPIVCPWSLSISVYHENQKAMVLFL